MSLQGAVSPPPSDADALASVIETIGAHEIRLVSELSLADLRDHLARDAPCRPVLVLDLAAAGSTDQAISIAINTIAGAVASLWPALWGEDWSAVRDDALARAHRPIRLAALARRLPSLSTAWAAASTEQLVRGARPRVPAAAPEIEWAQLNLAFSPEGSILVVPVEIDQGTGARITALEWLVRHGRVSALVLVKEWPRDALFERISHGALRFRPRAMALTAAREDDGAELDAVVPVVLALSRAPEGQPHPMSPTEQALHRLIQSDEELRPLFVFNRTVPGLALLTARVDLLWAEGRVAVEIDGNEHRGVAKYRADRHRDYELMCAGYSVLRMTNEDVATDAAVALEKIRRVARLARREAR